MGGLGENAFSLSPSSPSSSSSPSPSFHANSTFSTGSCRGRRHTLLSLYRCSETRITPPCTLDTEHPVGYLDRNSNSSITVGSTVGFVSHPNRNIDRIGSERDRIGGGGGGGADRRSRKVEDIQLEPEADREGERKRSRGRRRWWWGWRR